MFQQVLKPGFRHNDHTGFLISQRFYSVKPVMQLLHSKQNPEVSLAQTKVLQISQEISQHFAPDRSRLQPDLVLMPVDPLHIYAYWQFGSASQAEHTALPDTGLTLRMYALPESGAAIKLRFDINIDTDRQQIKIPLPVADTAYFANIGKIDAQQRFNIIASSNTARVPRMAPLVKTKPKPVHTTEQQTINPSTPETEQQVDAKFANATGVAKFPGIALKLKDFHHYGYDLIVYKNEFEKVENETIWDLESSSESVTSPIVSSHFNASGQR